VAGDLTGRVTTLGGVWPRAPSVLQGRLRWHVSGSAKLKFKMNKVYGGTVTTDLCQRCSHFVQIQGISASDCKRLCRRVGKIDFEVATCPLFANKEFKDTDNDIALHLDFDSTKDALLITRRSSPLANGRALTVAQYVKRCENAKDGIGQRMRRRSTATRANRSNPVLPN
jgi:hypothetical protein